MASKREFALPGARPRYSPDRVCAVGHYQIALELYFFEHMTGPEIAEVLGIPEPTVRTRLRRGRLALQEQVKVLASSPADVRSTLDRLEDWAVSIRAQVGGTRPEVADA